MMAPLLIIGLWGCPGGETCQVSALQSQLSTLLTVVVQDDLVEVPPTGLPPNVLLNHVSSQLVKVDGVGERFTGNISSFSILSPIRIKVTWWTGC